MAFAQVIIIEFGSTAMKVSEGGIHGYHWLIAVILGFSVWVVGFFFRFIPETICPTFGKQNAKTDDEDAAYDSVKKKTSITSMVRRGHSK